MEYKFYNLALRFLSYRPRSEKEVRDRLKFKIQNSLLRRSFGGQAKFKIEESVIDKVIDKLKKQGFINDEEFAKWWVESRLRFKPRSLRLIKMELKQKGVDPETIEKLIADRGSQVENDLESAKRLIEKKMNRSRNKFGMTPEKLGRYLASKGFSWDTVKKSIDPVKS